MKETRETRVIEEPKVLVKKNEDKTKNQGGSNLKTILENVAKLAFDVLVIGGATVLSGALALYVKNKSKDAFNEAMRQQKEIKRASKEKIVASIKSFQ